MIIKATQFKHGRPQGGGGARVGRRPPPSKKNIKNWLYWGPFCYFFFIWGPFCYFFFIWGPFCFVFLILGAFSPCGCLFATFYFMVGAFFGLTPPPPLRKFLLAPMIARRVREHAPGDFFV